MLSRSYLRPFTLFKKPMFYFRMSTNPYVSSEVKINQVEAEKQESLPVWERIFDHKKYIEHEGPLKMSTGLAIMDVEPFPRLKLMKLYYMLLEELRDVPDQFGYKQLIEELTKHRMEVVDQNKNIRQIEITIASGLIEELIIQGHNEIKLIRLMKKWKPWEMAEDAEDIDFREQLLSMNPHSIFGSPNEDFQFDRHDKPERPKTAGFDKEEE